MLDVQTALVYTMILCSAADSEMNDQEFNKIGVIVRGLPIFEEFDRSALPRIASSVVDKLNEDEGLDRLLDDIHAALPENLLETAYALACDVVAADGQASQEELRLLELLRYRFEVPRLSAAAIEHGARARHQRH